MSKEPLTLGRPFFDRPFLTVARELIGQTLLWQGCGGRIVEVEAYGIEDDAACHTATRKSSRIFCQENPPGTAYVYLNYGIHWMLNVLAGDGILLIRALEPQHGIAAMQERRRQQSLRALCSGPGKLGQALGLTGADHGHDLTKNIFYPGSTAGVVTGRRIGISKAVDLPWRFLEKESPWISVPLPRQASLFSSPGTGAAVSYKAAALASAPASSTKAICSSLGLPSQSAP